MGCFSCFDSKEEEKLNPQKDRDNHNRKQVHLTASSNVSRLSSGLSYHDPIKMKVEVAN